MQNPKRENIWLNFGFNLILPILILRKGDDWLGDPLSVLLNAPSDGPLVGSFILVLAVLFPIGYGIWDLLRRKRWNIISILGAVSAFLTGGIGLVPGATVEMFAIKEAALPGLFAILTVATLNTKKPLVKLFLYNPDVINVDRVETALEERSAKAKFDRLLAQCTWYIASTFILSAILNYTLARIIVKTEPHINKASFNDEVGSMMGWSFPIISIPCMIVTAFAFWQLIKGIKSHAGLSIEEVLVGAEQVSKNK
ncbi:MAG: hypothetical protein CMI26_03710 [Opitutae bacterium]|nr:hypothetical protein [Opitutae bacterium]|tara:strand:- start:4465 stop:5226 length:762 start_codon:yes stop_codon:yes gene_type:complete